MIIGESDPESCAACTDKQYEYRNGPAYASYTAAVFPRKLELALDSALAHYLPVKERVIDGRSRKRREHRQ